MKNVKLSNAQIEALLWAIRITEGALAGNDELDKYEIADLKRLTIIEDRLTRAMQTSALV
jgi:hypothetical protein